MKVDTGTKLMAFATVRDTEIGLEFRDIKLFDGSNGEFVKFPEKTYEDKDGKDAYMALIAPIWEDDEIDETGKEYMAEMAEAVSAAYAEAGDTEKPRARSGGGSSTKGRSSGRSSSARTSSAPSRKPAGKSGRGPVSKSKDRTVGGDW
jgi:DNA-binding cell septation regulator SpoVG